ncbi:unnamed protein product [Cuscuta campestris]|uniref:Uncharacterized protein n=1 Tax=Cuscuta campestris TaxID=132261 RepID=A0A484N0M2_9ASTE|nr:unnamed protein product [Cuscuta campestris]
MLTLFKCVAYLQTEEFFGTVFLSIGHILCTLNMPSMPQIYNYFLFVDLGLDHSLVVTPNSSSGMTSSTSLGKR